MVAGVLCGASVLSLVLSLVMPPISQAIANDAQTISTEATVADASVLGEEAGAGNSTAKDAENLNSDDVENGEASGDAGTAGPSSDDTEAESDAQPADAKPSDDETNDESAIAPASVSADGYTEVNGDVAGQFASGGKFRLTGPAHSDTQIVIANDTTIDLAGNMLYNDHGAPDSFFVVQSGAKLTIEDLGNKTIDQQTQVNDTSAGQPAAMTWEKGDGSSSNGDAPKSLTYYETRSAPKTDGLGTTETTYKHVVTGFGAIDAASDSGSVKHVVKVEAGGTLNLEGGMITTAANLGNDGHVIFSQGTVNISGGYVTNGSGGGWGGGLCITGNNAKLEMTGGVIAGNKAGSGGGVYADQGATLKLAGGIISGNATYGKDINKGEDTGDGGYGGGVYTKGANVTISGSACITNNRVDARIANSNLYNYGLLGGGGIACTNGGKLSIAGGLITANYSHEAGGGIYAGFYNGPIGFEMTGGTIAGNVADNAEGGGLRVSSDTFATISAGENSKIYITNNKTNTGSTTGRGGDWGGGGVFIQKGGKLNIVKTLITNNEAGGWGGGVGACPTGETIVSHSNGAAIYNNTDKGEHFSAGGNGKNEDSNSDDYITGTFKDAGHKDFFLVRNKNGADKTVAVVLGKMLGGGSAGWKGTCDGKEITIDPNGGAEAKYMFGLEAHPTEDAMAKAQTVATTIISGNSSYTHGGGIMTNGDLIVGEVNDLSVYPNMMLNATKVLVDADGNSQKLEGHKYKFQLLRQDSTGTKAPSWKKDGTIDMGDCSVAGEATVDESNGNITFDSGKDYSSGKYIFYLVEEPISGENELDTKFDKTIYKIVATVDSNPYKTDHLMSIPIKYYKVNEVTVYKKAVMDNGFERLGSGGYSVDYSLDKTTATVTIGDKDNPTFTNKIEPYTSSGSWTPLATKVVEGGEMKEFTLELAANENFSDAKTVTTTAGGDKSQTLGFGEFKYDLASLKQSDSDVPGRGASKTFTYYVREKTDGSLFPHYTYDKSVYQITVKATDDTKGHINISATYKQIQDRDGKPVINGTDHELNGNSTPTFTNTYSTSLPLSGMSGVTLTYLAGAAVLCAAAAWMHIRRKANAKGGERRE